MLLALLFAVCLTYTIAAQEPRTPPLPAWTCQDFTKTKATLGGKDLGVFGLDAVVGNYVFGVVIGAIEFVPPNADAAVQARYKKVSEFGLTAEIAYAHVSSYCANNPKSTLIEGALELISKVLK
jgi:hypothetical protein